MNISNRGYLRNRLRAGLVCLMFFLTLPLHAQQGLPMNILDLQSLDSFDSPPANWVLGSDVYMDLFERHHVEPSGGSGVLINTNRGESPRDIFTNWEHGDLDLELEFMMAANSNSGIYLQGRYEVQMLDSWGVTNPKFYDMGGVYQWWEDGVGTGGIAPRVNASRAPGLWQHMEIQFRAPRFDEEGNKTEHAKLKEVKLNGVVIHRNVNLVHPTGGAISNEEASMGPLRFQGDHGPVAFRNIRYKTYHNEPLQLENITYQYKTGDFESAIDVTEAPVVSDGSLDKLDLSMLRETGNIGIVYNATVTIEQTGDYYVDVRSDGGHLLMIGGTVISETGDSNRRHHPNRRITELPAGTHDVELVYFRGARGGQPAFGIFAEGPGIELHPLHRASALPTGNPNLPLMVVPTDGAKVMHGFMDMDGEVRTHTAAVGDPEGAHFAFDQNSSALMKVWKGEFLNASTMWVGRGGRNLSLNEEAAITLGSGPSVAIINGRRELWPSGFDDSQPYRFMSYQTSEDGSVLFSYQAGETTIRDHIRADDDGKALRRTLIAEPAPRDGDRQLFLRVARASEIEELPNGVYQVDGNRFYIQLHEDTHRHARVRTSGEYRELLVPVADLENYTADYSIIW